MVDLILSLRNDPTIDVHDPKTNARSMPSVRNGNRWRVAALDATTNRVAAERLNDRARVVFDCDYLREHISLGYAVTVHSAQGVTADTSHAVLSENVSRALLYVAMTRGRQTNTAHLCQRSTGDHEYGQSEPDGTHLKSRGDAVEAAGLIRGIVDNDDQPAITAHDYAGRGRGTVLPRRVQSLLNRRATASSCRQRIFAAWQAQAQAQERGLANSRRRARERHADRSRTLDDGLEL